MPKPTQELELIIGGMACASCVAHVEKALASVDGVSSASVNLATERARVVLAHPVAPEELILSVEQAGYKAGLANSEDRDKQTKRRERERVQLKQQFILSAILTLPVFVMAMGGHVIPALHHWSMTTLGHWNWVIQALLTRSLKFPC